MATSRVMWFTRDKVGSTSDKIFVWPYRAYPEQDEYGIYESDMDPVAVLCADGFKTLTGITLKPGQRVKKRLVDA